MSFSENFPQLPRANSLLCNIATESGPTFIQSETVELDFESQASLIRVLALCLEAF